ncbi:MAG TPA: protein kinase [Candidatus Acidoferrales bacterium]|nr:protein kinase [Candidatus Acidoferrales bacterium]
MPLTPGTNIGAYRVISALGAGGMGEVYRARDTRLSRDVAIKVLPSFLSYDPDRLRRFEQEARAAAALNHPSILVVFQMGTYEGAPYLVSELLEGDTLREQLKRGSMPLRKVMDCGVQIARGLAAAHEKGIAHRDLKPENLFATKDGRVKILDFGLAKLTQREWTLDSNAPTASDMTEPGALMGTVGYMSPEQASGKSADHRTDIFSFGAILYEMLTGNRAFQKPTSAETMSAILNEDPPRISRLAPATPPALQRVVQRCLEKNPEQRFQSASDLAFALEALSDSSSASAAGVAQPRSRRIWLEAAAALVLVALAVAAGGYAWLRAKRRPPAASQAGWVQITDFADSAVAPALSPDGRVLTFVRGGDAFIGEGQIDAKLLPGGEPVQLTHDSLRKMSPQFSPDGSTIAYTVDGWNTWSVPALGGEARSMMPNAEGVTWIDAGHLLFSEIKTGVHMGVVTATETRGARRDIYVPARERGMAHRSALSPDHKWVLVAEMDNGGWLPCRLVPFDAGSSGKRVGPPGAGCTYVAWSPDQSWMYFSSDAGGGFHIWRQRFPDGEPQQVTSGATEEEGIAMAPDGGSLITSVGSRQSTLWVRDGKDERQISSEGYADVPRFSPDGTKLYYLVRRNGVSGQFFNGELWVADLKANRSERVVPGFLVSGYDISPDGTKVVFAAAGADNHSHVWLASLDFGLPPRQFVSSVNEDEPNWDGSSHIYFRAAEGELNYLYRMKEDGSERVKTLPYAILEFHAVSPDGRWALATEPKGQDPKSHTAADPLDGGTPVTVCPGYCVGRWSADGRTFAVVIDTFAFMADARHETETLVAPVSRAAGLPPLPPLGLRTQADMEAVPGAKVSPGAVSWGPKAGLSASVHHDVHRNLYKVPLQ